jgi:FkbM family methyltransferase
MRVSRDDLKATKLCARIVLMGDRTKLDIYRGKRVSFAQNGEDIVLLRALKSVSAGLYIDVGAANPIGDSVTKLFYDAGWRGINIEPHPFWFGLLKRERPRDINLRLAASNRAGRSNIYGIEGPPGGGATLEERDHLNAAAVSVQTRTLSAICAEFVGDRRIDFLKVDVEGHEFEVLQGIDLARWRPCIIVVELLSGQSDPELAFECDDLLEHAGYKRTLFDGINAFYVSAEHGSLLSADLQVAANALDNFVPYRFLPLHRRLRYVTSARGVWARAHRRGMSVTKSAPDLVRHLIRGAARQRRGSGRL